MTWRNRKLFNTLPQGIVSGLEPIPRYQMGGMVQGYETGGPFPNKGLAALNKVAPEVVKKMGYEDGGFINPRNYLGGGTVQYPIGMEMGSLVPEENFMERGINNMLESLGIETDVNKVRQNKRDKTERKNKAISEANNFVKNLMAEYMDGTKTGGDFIKEYGGIGDLKLRYIEKKYPDVYENFYSNQFGLRSKLNRATETFDQAIGMEAGALVPEENFMERGINNMLESLGIETDVNKVRQNKRDKAERKIRANIEATNFVKNLMAEYMDGTKTGGDFIREYGSIPDLKFRYIEKKYPDVYEDFYSMPFGLRSKLNRATETFDQAIGMEMGSLVPEVFESGDQQINDALNTMVATTMPTGDATTMPTGDATTMPIGDATTTIPMEDPVGGVEMVAEDTTGDSSSKEALFMTQVNEQKNILQQTIERLIAEKSEENLDPMNLKTQIGDFIVKADSLFKRKVTEIANKLNVEVLPEQVTLLTDDFAEKLEVMFPRISALEPDEDDMQVASMDQGLEIPGMEHGGLHIADNVPESVKKNSRFLMLEHKKNQLLNFYESYEKMPENIKKSYDALVQQQITLSGKVVGKQEDAAEAARKKEIERLTDIITSRYAADISKEDAQKKLDALTKTKETLDTKPPDTEDDEKTATTTEPELKDLLGQSAEDIRKAALMTSKSKQGGVLGFMDVVGQSNIAAAKADRDALLKRYEVDSITTARMDKANEDAFNSFLRDSTEEEALESYILSGRTLPKSRQSIVPSGTVGGQNFATYLRQVRKTGSADPLTKIVADFAANTD